jgi:hypothetical protein
MMYLLASSTLAFSGVSKLAASRVAAPRAAQAQMFTVNLVTPDGPQTVRTMLTCTNARRGCLDRRRADAARGYGRTFPVYTHLPITSIVRRSS